MAENLGTKPYSIFAGLFPHRLVEYLKHSREWQSLKGVIKTDGFFIFLGAFTGLALIILEDKYKLKDTLNFWPHSLGLVMEHGGLGLIVSALAVFGYEWRSNAKKAFDLTEELVRLREVEGIEAIHRGLEAVFGGEVHNLPENLKTVFNSLKKVIAAIQELNKNKSWANRQYIGFVSDLLDTSLLNAVNLSNLEKEEVNWMDFIVPVTAAKLADKFLAKHMMALTAGDTYEVISDFTSWQGRQLEEFHNDATKQAVKNGAEVIRVFNLLSVRDEEVSEEQVREILRKHLKDARDWTGEKGYKVKVFGFEDFAVLRRNFPQDFKDKKRAMDSHFGIFKHRNEIVCVMVREADLSKMQLCSKFGSVKTDVEKLERIIIQAKLLTPDLTEEGLSDQIDNLIGSLKLKSNKRRRRKQTSTEPLAQRN